MTTCPNCGHKISDTDDICPNCGFNLKKYRDDFFTDKHQKAKYEEPDEVEKLLVVQHIVKSFLQKSRTPLFKE